MAPKSTAGRGPPGGDRSYTIAGRVEPLAAECFQVRLTPKLREALRAAPGGSLRLRTDAVSGERALVFEDAVHRLQWHRESTTVVAARLAGDVFHEIGVVKEKAIVESSSAPGGGNVGSGARVTRQSKVTVLAQPAAVVPLRTADAPRSATPPRAAPNGGGGGSASATAAAANTASRRSNLPAKFVRDPRIKLPVYIVHDLAVNRWTQNTVTARASYYRMPAGELQKLVEKNAKLHSPGQWILTTEALAKVDPAWELFSPEERKLVREKRTKAGLPADPPAKAEAPAAAPAAPAAAPTRGVKRDAAPAAPDGNGHAQAAKRAAVMAPPSPRRDAPQERWGPITSRTQYEEYRKAFIPKYTEYRSIYEELEQMTKVFNDLRDKLARAATDEQRAVIGARVKEEHAAKSERNKELSRRHNELYDELQAIKKQVTAYAEAMANE